MVLSYDYSKKRAPSWPWLGLKLAGLWCCLAPRARSYMVLTASLLALLTDNLVLGKPPQGSSISTGYAAGICTLPRPAKYPEPS